MAPQSPTGNPRTACSGRARARTSRGAICCCRFRRWCCRSPCGWCGAWSSCSCRDIGFRFSANQLFWLAALPGLAGGTLRLFFSFMVPVFGGRTWTALSTAALLDPDDRPRARGAGPGDRLPDVSGAGAGGRHRRRQLRVEHGEHQLLLSGRAQGRGAGLERGARQPGRGPGAGRRAARRRRRAVRRRSAGRRSPGTTARATREIWLQNAGYVWVPLIVAAALAAWFGMDDLAPVKASFEDAGGDLHAQAQLDPVVALPRHLRLVHRLRRRIPAAGARRNSPASTSTAYAFVGPLLGALARPAGGWLADRIGGARVALACFGAMALVVAALLLRSGATARPAITTFLALFVAAVRRERRGQRRRVPDDPRRVRRRPPARTCRPGRRARRGRCPKARSKAPLRSASRRRSRRSAASSFRRPTARRSRSPAGPRPRCIPFSSSTCRAARSTWWFYVRRDAELPC